MPRFFENFAGAVLWTRPPGLTTPVQGDELPDEQSGSGAPEPGAQGRMLAGDVITFNDLSSGQTSALTGTVDNILEETDGSGADQTTINSPLFGQPAGTQINTGYAISLTDGTNTYTMYAISFGPNNNDPGSRDFTDMFTFEGVTPPEGVALTVDRVINIASVAFDNVVCFTSGSRIHTEHGQKEVESLRVGDLVWVSRNGAETLAPIRWIGRRSVVRAELLRNPKFFPVRILAGSLGCGLPVRDLLVSRQHRMLARSRIVQRMTGENEVLVPAIALTKLPGIFVDDSVESVEYFHILFDDHEIIRAEGVETESFFTGPQALQSLSNAAYSELISLFPELAKEGYEARLARVEIRGSKSKRLVERHLVNRRHPIEANDHVFTAA